MQKTCNNCGTDKRGEGQVIFTEYGYEAHEARHEREKKRLWTVILVLIAALLVTNFAWILYECSFEDYVITQEVEQDAESGNNSFVGGDYYGEAENQGND